eukprot:212238-Chlamydomonas_euryale.AAC.1
MPSDSDIQLPASCHSTWLPRCASTWRIESACSGDAPDTPTAIATSLGPGASYLEMITSPSVMYSSRSLRLLPSSSRLYSDPR